ncbi:hypothetical protein KY284_010505 [Solanum tuberosum]|nr:hypothetical protein KY284_010505 [Solanum tuberosum]
MMILYDQTINQVMKLAEMNFPQPIAIESPVSIKDVTSKPSRRVKHVGKFQKSPFITDFDSDGSYKVEYGKEKIFSLKHPFNEKIDEDVDYALREKFAVFVDKWTLKGRSKYVN